MAENAEASDLLFGDDVTDESTETESAELTVNEEDTTEEVQTEEETEVDETEESEEAQEEDSEETEEESIADDDDTDQEDDDTELFLDLDGEEVSLSDVREWKENGINAKKFTQLRQDDAKREQRNKAAEDVINSQADRLIAITQSGEDLLKSLQSDGLVADEDFKALSSKIEGIQTKLVEDRTTSMNAYIANEQEILAKRNKHWIKDGELTEAFQRDKVEVEEYLRKEGFSDNDMSQIVDNRVRMAFQKAAKYDKLQKKTVQVKKKLKKVPMKAKPKPKPKPKAKPPNAEEAVFGEIH